VRSTSTVRFINNEERYHYPGKNVEKDGVLYFWVYPGEDRGHQTITAHAHPDTGLPQLEYKHTLAVAITALQI